MLLEYCTGFILLPNHFIGWFNGGGGVLLNDMFCRLWWDVGEAIVTYFKIKYCNINEQNHGTWHINSM